MNNSKNIILVTLLAILSVSSGIAQSVNDIFSVRFKTYDYERYNLLVGEKEFVASQNDLVEYNSSKWQTEIRKLSSDSEHEYHDYQVTLKCLEGKLDQSSVSLVFLQNQWNPSNFVLMPGALYNGNKYDYRRIRYSPKLMDPRDIGKDVPILLSDVPRLNNAEGPSRVQLRSGATTSPSISFYDSIQKKGFILLTTQANEFGDFGLEIEESRSRTKAEFLITSPLVRERHQYLANDNLAPSQDKPVDFKAGDVVTFRFTLYEFPAANVQALYDKFAMVRKKLNPKQSYNNVIPMSHAFEILESKFKRDNWVDVGDNGYFAVGMRENFLQDFQTGWTGGMISTYPLLFSEKQETRNLVVKNFNWYFPNSISPSGLLYGFCEGGTDWFGGDKRKYHTKNWILTRKNADAIFYITNQLELMKARNIPVEKKWENGLKTVCDALVDVWNQNEQIGQFIDAQTGEVQVGGSSSAGVLPGGLVLASNYFNNRDYLKTAEAIGDYFYKNFTEIGISCGGPGDALQNFDSESAYALVESYYILYEATGDKKWEKAAGEAARQFSTWVIAYNYQFPETSTFGKLGNKSIGGVWANTQNTHGSPGICTHSGLALLKLFRSTGDTFYADLLADITHAIPQCLSVPSRKIMDAPDGWMSERLSTTDWNEGIGEIFVGTTWAETALMLTYMQIPGVYVCADKSEVVSFDNIIAEIVQDTPKYIKVKLENPTNLDAKIKVWEENSKDRESFLGQNYLLNSNEVTVKKNSSKVITFKK